MTKNILLLPGDGIGPEIMREAVKVLDCLDLDLSYTEMDFGGIAVDKHGSPLPDATLATAREADAILLGAVGGPQYDALERAKRPETGLLRLRKKLDLFANLRPTSPMSLNMAGYQVHTGMPKGSDLMIVRELTGGLYFGEPRGREDGPLREARNTMRYNEKEIRRIAEVAFGLAQQRSKRVCSVDKANVLEVSQLWREVVTEVAADFPEVELSHMYVDNAAMQLVVNPAQFDVLLTGNIFGDILSDLAGQLSGSIGTMPSASLSGPGKPAVYEPVHGSAPDLAGTGRANPLAMILSAGTMLRYSLGCPTEAFAVYDAAAEATRNHACTDDLLIREGQGISCSEMGDAVCGELKKILAKKS